MSKMIVASRQQTFVSLMRLQALGVSDIEIKNMAQLMDFGSMSLAKENNNANTKQRLADILENYTGSQLSTVHRVEV